MKKYIYNNTSYFSLADLRRALAQDNKAFGNPTSVEGWEELGVTIENYEVPPSPAEIQKKLVDAVQEYMDRKAQELNYDNCLSVCSYFNSGVEKFDKEGAAFRTWRSAVWQKCYQVLDECLAGTRSVPTSQELIEELPLLDINYAD